jgi:triacylglycerol esterase/lipase EstA (alpha/beta hydrolase family)
MNEEYNEDEIVLLKLQLEAQVKLQEVLVNGIDLGVDNMFDVAYNIGSALASSYVEMLDTDDVDVDDLKDFFANIGKITVQGYLDKVSLILDDSPSLIKLNLDDE